MPTRVCPDRWNLKLPLTRKVPGSSAPTFQPAPVIPLARILLLRENQGSPNPLEGLEARQMETSSGNNQSSQAESSSRAAIDVLPVFGDPERVKLRAPTPTQAVHLDDATPGLDQVSRGKRTQRDVDTRCRT